MSVSRRDFLKKSMLSTGGLFLPYSPLFSSSNSEHFFIIFIVQGGLDTTYTFDARERSFTHNEILANYMPKDQEAFLWKGANGVETLANHHMKNLLPYKDYFSIINGVLMATSFDGHPQNMNHLFTGGAFGGESFIPHLHNNSLIDYLLMGQVFANITNSGSSLSLTDKNSIEGLSKIFAKTPNPKDTQISQFLKSRYNRNSLGPGLFSKGALSLNEASNLAPNTISKLKKVPIPNTDDELLFKLETAFQYFKQGLTNSCIIDLDLGELIDTHDGTTAKKSPKVAEIYAQEVAKIIDFLNNKNFTQNKSMMDQTTFMITSEFSRTMRQKNLKITDTGTDHNPLNNTVIVGGKGVRSSLVIGKSDRNSIDEKLSGAHQIMDPENLKIMGKPFDFHKMKTKENFSPENFKIEDYLTIDSVINTMYQLLAVDKSSYRSYDRDKKIKVPTISKLLSSSF